MFLLCHGTTVGRGRGKETENKREWRVMRVTLLCHGTTVGRERARERERERARGGGAERELYT